MQPDRKLERNSSITVKRKDSPQQGIRSTIFIVPIIVDIVVLPHRLHRRRRHSRRCHEIPPSTLTGGKTVSTLSINVGEWNTERRKVGKQIIRVQTDETDIQRKREAHSDRIPNGERENEGAWMSKKRRAGNPILKTTRMYRQTDSKQIHRRMEDRGDRKTGRQWTDTEREKKERVRERERERESTLQRKDRESKRALTSEIHENKNHRYWRPPTQDPQPVVDGDHHHPSLGQVCAVVLGPGPPYIASSVDAHHHWQLGLVGRQL